jgi:hypothetical protein
VLGHHFVGKHRGTARQHRAQHKSQNACIAFVLNFGSRHMLGRSPDDHSSNAEVANSVKPSRKTEPHKSTLPARIVSLASGISFHYYPSLRALRWAILEISGFRDLGNLVTPVPARSVNQLFSESSLPYAA